MKKFTEILSKFRTRFTDAMSRLGRQKNSLPALEQLEKGTAAYAAVQSCGSIIDSLESMVKDGQEGLEGINVDEMLKSAVDETIAERVENGDLIKKESFDEQLKKGDLMRKGDAETAANLAADEREKKVRGELTTVATRRVAIATKKSDTEPALVSAELASKISEDVLKADNYVDQVKKIAGRVADMQAKGIKTPEVLNSAADFATDDKGENEFKLRFAGICDMASRAGGGGGGTAAEPFAQNNGGGGSQQEESLVGTF